MPSSLGGKLIFVVRQGRLAGWLAGRQNTYIPCQSLLLSIMINWANTVSPVRYLTKRSCSSIDYKETGKLLY